MILRLNQTDRRIVDSLSRPLAAVPLALCNRRRTSMDWGNFPEGEVMQLVVQSVVGQRMHDAVWALYEYSCVVSMAN
jgi:hypothetical protein